MRTFLEQFAVLVAGVLQGFDRVVFKGRLRRLYWPQGMNNCLWANGVLRKDFKRYAAEVTGQVLEASLVSQAKQAGRYRYLNSCNTDKEQVARAIAQEQQVERGLVCVLQCVEPCWTFDTAKTPAGLLTVRGEPGKCSHLYHYYIHPEFGWMYVRLQTWFPFEIQVGINGREWLSRQLDREGLSYQRSDNKFLRVEDWQRAQQLLDGQLRTNWERRLDTLQRQVHPLHPLHLGRMPVLYNWTVFQSEWATDVAFHAQEDLEKWYDRWLRQALLSYDSVDVLRFLGRSGRIDHQGPREVKTELHNYFEGKRIKHWLEHNSLKLYTHYNVLRPEMTINNPRVIQVYRRSTTAPRGPQSWRPLRCGVVDMPLRAEVGQATNERYLEALATTAATRTVKELAEPLTRRVPEPGVQATRKVRGLNPLAAEDAALLTAVSDPKWMLQGFRNRDLVAALYGSGAKEKTDQRRQSAHVTRLLRMLRAHQLIDKVTGTHRYQVGAEARLKIQALLAVRNANPDELTAKAA